MCADANYSVAYCVVFEFPAIRTALGPVKRHYCSSRNIRNCNSTRNNF